MSFGRTLDLLRGISSNRQRSQQAPKFPRRQNRSSGYTFYNDPGPDGVSRGGVYPRPQMQYGTRMGGLHYYGKSPQGRGIWAKDGKTAAKYLSRSAWSQMPGGGWMWTNPTMTGRRGR